MFRCKSKILIIIFNFNILLYNLFVTAVSNSHGDIPMSVPVGAIVGGVEVIIAVIVALLVKRRYVSYSTII